MELVKTSNIHVAAPPTLLTGRSAPARQAMAVLYLCVNQSRQKIQGQLPDVAVAATCCVG